ncbi:hypothetical protein KL918_005052 [Ogataea parapolymorpha]|uniref:U5 small nuclear ribonucleoprotein n=1 Tax=Ogataea parapolymorpha (strain ATCC 26012 / BCRC 20466 / JCM 22074 / NRRL Y-7560 / DL-1) TaxID=871575 RepID=W1QJH6_OGAPD|nr:U5 small nuclear ribonucleoprotein [Ogataea parapolymorpha DL-1]ESX02002.1 U5 small nuclear ribonucleoprotein [Ogataea parapolymorpha DL-1]KAG7864926.1 hypothetical protein KL918_005052 [Ogataea parapolymorpha]KAG7871572.1 hypothetical protein KL916_003923 [Ogataea parapolymorpha]
MSLVVHQNGTSVPYVLRLNGHKGAVLANRFNEDGTLVASGGVDRNLIVWKIPDSPELIREELPYEYNVANITKSAITSIRWSHLNENHLLVASADSTATVFDITKNQKIKTFHHKMCINEISNSENDMLVTCSDDRSVKLWDSRSRFEIDSIQHKYPLLTVTIDSRDQRFYFAGIDPTVSCYDARKRSTLCWEECNQTNNVTSLALSPDESYLVSKSVDNTIKYYDSRLYTKGLRARPYVFDGAKASPDDFLIRLKAVKKSDGKEYIISGSNDAHVYVWDFASRRLKSRLDGHLGTVLDVDSVNDRLISGSIDGALILRSF